MSLIESTIQAQLALRVRALQAENESLRSEIERLRDTLKRQDKAHHIEVQEQVSAERERADELVEADGRDADRFHWLTEDHDDAETRAKCRDLLGRLGVMGRGAARADIDSAMADDIKRSMLRTVDAHMAARKEA